MKILLFTIIFLLGCPDQDSTQQNPEPVPEPTVSIPVPTPDPSPTPGGTPSECACLVRWGIGKQPHIALDAQGNLVDTPVRGGRVVYDTTPRHERFPGDTVGGPCNSEQDNCGGRRCEDIRGGIFSVEGPSAWVVNPRNNFQVKINNLQLGRHVIKISPRSDLQDPQGVPVRICPQASNGDGSDSTVMNIP